ncbi:MAG: D-alanyl-D-alanine endopeptidase [Gammaproteobacteria bacterium]|nr:D-alanyl-D-alanine endopeptidase [Gammaproteobacteria bacterium]
MRNVCLAVLLLCFGGQYAFAANTASTSQSKSAKASHRQAHSVAPKAVSRKAATRPAAAKKTPTKAKSAHRASPRRPAVTSNARKARQRSIARRHSRPRASAPAAGAQLAGAGRALQLQSTSVLVIDRERNTVLLARNPDERSSIASITKLMTAMVTLDARLPMEQTVTISNEDIDRYKGTHSRLSVGTHLTRRDILRLALMSSENRAAAALARTYPGGRAKFIAAMNSKAQALGMRSTTFVDAAGLKPQNRSTANDLAKMVQAASNYALIREFTTTTGQTVSLRGGRSTEEFNNTNRLVRYKDPDWKIEVSKTGYTSEAGRCLVMQARTADRPLILVLLDSPGKLTPIGDANRVRRWLETQRIGHGLASK